MIIWLASMPMRAERSFTVISGPTVILVGRWGTGWGRLPGTPDRGRLGTLPRRSGCSGSAGKLGAASGVTSASRVLTLIFSTGPRLARFFFHCWGAEPALAAGRRTGSGGVAAAGRVTPKPGRGAPPKPGRGTPGRTPPPERAGPPGPGRPVPKPGRGPPGPGRGPPNPGRSAPGLFAPGRAPGLSGRPPPGAGPPGRMAGRGCPAADGVTEVRAAGTGGAAAGSAGAAAGAAAGFTGGFAVAGAAPVAAPAAGFGGGA